MSLASHHIYGSSRLGIAQYWPVLSYSISKMKTEYQKVINKFQAITDTVVTVIVGNDRIETTPAHSFYVNSGVWVPARNLSKNDRIWYSNGTKGFILNVRIDQKVIKVFNFEVENNKNYFVSPDKILVHNGQDLRCQ